jgi:hypothetical protein
MAAFQVITIGRFWVITEGLEGCDSSIELLPPGTAAPGF